MNLIEQTKEAFLILKSSVITAMQLLYQLRESGEWQQVSSTWSDFVKDELGLSQGFASRLLSVNQHYLVEGGVSPEKLAEIDHEKLYLAAQTEGTVEEQIEKARLLNRRELREEKIDGGHIHDSETVEIYKCCGMRKQPD